MAHQQPILNDDDAEAPSGAVPIRDTFTPPADWPEPGPIDLGIHDLPHASSTLEWWYINCHLQLEDGNRAAIFAAFFRQRAPQEFAGTTLSHTHSVAWAVSLPERARHISKVAVDGLAPRVGLAHLDAGVKSDDPRLERALREVLARGRMPGPTRMFRAAPHVADTLLRLDYDGDRFAKSNRDGSYGLELSDAVSGVACQLRFALQKPATRYGRDGVVNGVSGEKMFYYFVPRAKVTGYVTLDGKTSRVELGSGWYDHEFGVLPRSRTGTDAARRLAERGETCWRWLSLQLGGGIDVSVFFITRRATGEVLDNWAMISDESGAAVAVCDAELTTLEVWQSTRTFIEYPIAFRIRAPSAQLDVVARAAFPDQEIVTIISDPAFWEGVVRVEGSWNGTGVVGQGWLECKGFGHETLDDFYAAVGKQVRGRLAVTLPRNPRGSDLSQLLVRGSPAGSAPHCPGIDGRRLGQSLVEPIRDIADRGGKGWRSYAALASIDVVGGDSRRFLHWLVLPEIVHVGSLIVDDVEDQSSVRRGGPACHLVHGAALAINAGTAAYFLAEPPLDDDALPAETKLRIYRLYFDALRAGHAGQALDLMDVRELASAAASSGDTAALERHVLAVHRLKTAIPAAMFSRAGALLGGGNEQQVERLGAFFEAVGLAFQIVDDVLDVVGFERGLKQRGEDLRNGKVTLPVVKALELLPPPERLWLLHSLETTPKGPGLITALSDVLVHSGALDACTTRSRQLVEQAWAELDPVLEDSQSKLMFRAFSWYVLERHY